MKTTSASRQQRKQITRQNILKAATQVFAEVGFDAASLGEIAKRCNAKKALIQYHFETKENLWQQSIDQLWGEMRATLPDYMLEPTDQMSQETDTIRHVFKQIIRFAKDHPAWVGIMFREASTPGPRLDWLAEHYLNKDFADGIQFVELAQQQQLLPQASPLHLLHIISGALTYALLVSPLTKKVTGVDMTSEESVEKLVDIIMLLLRNNR